MTIEKDPLADEMAQEEPTGRSLVPIEARLTMIDVDGAAAAYEAYLELCRRILDENDYAEIRGLKARKRSGWAKLRRFYNISTRIILETRRPIWDRWEAGQPFVYHFTIEGCMGDRIEQADGTCESTELEGSNIAPTEHNVRAKALTRAKNRVTSDLIGGGEVSAEELNSVASAKPKKGKKHWIEYGGASKKFEAWTQERMGLTNEQVLEALGVEKVTDYKGTMKEAKQAIEQWLAGQIEEEQEQSGG